MQHQDISKTSLVESEMKKRIEWKNIRFVPILHNRMEFAVEVKRQFEEFRPDHVAVEYPDTLGRKILQGIKRLPLLLSIGMKKDIPTIFLRCRIPIQSKKLATLPIARPICEFTQTTHLIQRIPFGKKQWHITCSV